MQQFIKEKIVVNVELLLMFQEMFLLWPYEKLQNEAIFARRARTGGCDSGFR